MAWVKRTNLKPSIGIAGLLPKEYGGVCGMKIRLLSSYFESWGMVILFVFSILGFKKAG